MCVRLRVIGAITAIITYILTIRHTKKEIKEQYRAKLGEKISEAYIGVRELLVQTDTIEIFEAEREMNIAEATSMREQKFYPSFMNSKEDYFAYVVKVTEARTKHEQYLDLTSAAYLYAIETYLMSLAVYMRDNKLFSVINEVGTLIIIDALKWSKLFDAHIVKMINAPKFKLFSKIGKRWENEKAKMAEEFLECSMLNLYIKGEIEFPLHLTAVAAIRNENE